MLREEKISTLTTKKQRLQLIRIYEELEDGSSTMEYWQIRLNRKRLNNEFYYPAAVKYFNAKVYSITNQLNLI